MRISWAEYALRLAETAAQRSADPYVQVGACALRHDNSVAALGYNGEPRKVSIDWTNRDERRKRVIHAECNMLRYCRPNEIGLVATTLSPCPDCLKQMAAYGVTKIVYREKYDKDDFSDTLAREFGIELIQLKREPEIQPDLINDFQIKQNKA